MSKYAQQYSEENVVKQDKHGFLHASVNGIVFYDTGHGRLLRALYRPDRYAGGPSDSLEGEGCIGNHALTADHCPCGIEIFRGTCSHRETYPEARRLFEAYKAEHPNALN